MDFLRALDPRRALLIVGTLLAAFFCGHVMQSGFFSDTAIRDGAYEAAPVLEDASRTPSLPVPPAATLTPLQVPPPPQIGIDDALIDSRLPLDDGFSPYGLECGPSLTLSPGQDADVSVHLMAPCRANAPVTVTHDTLVFSGQTDAFGRLTLRLPAMTYEAQVTVTFDDAVRVSSSRLVPGFDEVRRVALVWSGPQILRMRATGPDGHQGYLSRIGAVSGAEVYTLPARSGVSTGVVRLSLDADVTAETCGRFVRARTVQAGAIGGAMVRDISLEMPSCDAVGQIVTFDGAFRDLRVAQR